MQIGQVPGAPHQPGEAMGPPLGAEFEGKSGHRKSGKPDHDCQMQQALKG